MLIPPYLLDLGKKHPEHKLWVENLPSLIQALTDRWNLKLEAPFLKHASCSYVAPCWVNEEYRAVLKIGLPHEEARDEIEGLRSLNGKPTVHLLHVDKKANAMLLEVCMPGTHLHRLPEEEQDEVICKLLPEIWETAFDVRTFRPLGEMVSHWNKETYEDLENFPDAELAKVGCRIKEKLIATTRKQVLLATDLHAGNVLKAERRDWLVIDLKPYYGDPTYDLTQHLLNCKERLRLNPAETIQRLAKLTGLNPKRLTAWMFARLASEEKGKHQALALRFKDFDYG